LERESLLRVVELMRAVDFYKEGHRKIFGAMVGLVKRNEPVDLLTLKEELTRRGELEEAGGVETLAGMVEEASTAVHVAAYAAILQEHADKRGLIQLGTQLIDDGYNGATAPTLIATATTRLEAIARPMRRGGDPARSTNGFRGLDEILALPLPPLGFLVEGLLVEEGAGFVAGEEKTGKTLFVEHLLLCLALGLPVGGRFAVPMPVPVAFVEEEDSVRRTRGRFGRMLVGLGLDPEDPALLAQLRERCRISVWSGIDFDRDEWWHRFADEFEARPPKLVVFDPLSKLTSRDLRKAEEVRPILNRLDDLRRRFGFAVLLVHHYRKGQGERLGRGSQEMFGSFVLGAWTEQSLFIEPEDRTGKLLCLSLQSKDVKLNAPLRLVITESDTAMTVTLDDLPTAAGTAERVWEAIGTATPSEPYKGSRGVGIANLVMALKLSDKTIRVAVQELLGQRRILEVGTTSKQAKLYARSD